MKSTIHIAIIRQRYNPYGGAERFVENALNALQQQIGIEITLITRQWDSSNNKNIHSIICNPFYIGRLWRDWSFARAACRIVQQSNFDLVQSHERIPCGDIYRAGDGVHREWLKKRHQSLSLLRKISIYLSPYHLYLLWQEKRTFTQPSLRTIIVNSNLIKGEITKNFSQINAHIEVIFNGVDCKKFHPRLKEKYRSTIRKQLTIDDLTPLLLFIGSGFERKGLSILLHALQQLPNTHLVIVGKDRNSKKYELIAEKLGISNRTHFIGPQNDTRPWYATADVFAFPTLYDPQPNVVLEAMASGLPVVASNNCGAVDLINDSKEGYTLPPSDIDSWIKALNETQKPQQRKQIGRNARASIEALTPKTLTDNMKRIYLNLLSEKLNK